MGHHLVRPFQESAGGGPENARDVVPGLAKTDEANMATIAAISPGCALLCVIMGQGLWRDISWNIVKPARWYTGVKPYGGA
jgi:hypothetical protein